MVYAKKHLGQHFLKDENIARNIVKSLSKKGYHKVLEIGPGTGLGAIHVAGGEVADQPHGLVVLHAQGAEILHQCDEARLEIVFLAHLVLGG